MKKIELFLVMLFISCLTVSAQTMEARGKVTYADDGTPVIGATIRVKGTSAVTISDANGTYKITIPSGTARVLEISYTGLKTQTINVPQNGIANAALNIDATMLDEVVATGYGNIRKGDFTGAATTVSTSDRRDIPSVSLQSRIVGTVPGLTVTSASGQPGAVESVRIRGMGSINAGNDPLYVIDGIPALSGNASSFGTGYSQSGNSIMSSMNPNDIESITIIKDAAAASLYGSRAANGVIVITTKKGAAGRTKFNAKVGTGVSNMASNWRPTLDGDATRELWTLALYNFSKYKENKTEAEANIYAAAEIDKYYKKPWNGWTNWRDELLRTGKDQSYEISAKGGNEKTQFFSSISYNKTEGVNLNSDYRRITGRLNLTHKTGRLTLDASALYSNVNQQYAPEGTANASSMLAIALNLSPADYPYNKDGSINITQGFHGIGNPRANPLQSIALNTMTNKLNRIQTNVSAKVDLWKGIAIKQVVGYDLLNANDGVWWHPDSGDGFPSGNNQRRMENSINLVSQSQLLYNQTFGMHNIDFLAGFETEQYSDDLVLATGKQFPNPGLPEIGNAATTTGWSTIEKTALMSGLARANYNYNSLYYVSGSFRTDGSSRLGSDNRWGNFWSASASWRMSNEEFWKSSGLIDIVNDAKLRASFGENGTLPASAYGWMGVYGYGNNYNLLPGSTETRIPNRNLGWEKNTSMNLGIDLTLYNIVSVTFDIYERKTKDLILDKPISNTTGFGTTLANIGSMVNRGFEADIRATVLDRNDFFLNLGLNLSHNKNKVIALADGQSEIQNGRWVHRINNPYYTFNIFEFAGVDPATGKEMYYENKPIYANPNDKTSEIIGYDKGEATTDATKVNKKTVAVADPKIAGGFNGKFGWKFIDLNFSMTFTLGGNTVDNYAVMYANGSGWAVDGIGIPSYNDIDKMWKKPGDIADLPMYAFGGSGNEYTSTLYMRSTDHIRMKNLTIGFTAPKSWTSKLGIERLRAYASGSNIFTIKDPKLYYDPETPVGGTVNFDTPPMRSFAFGIELGF